MELSGGFPAPAGLVPRVAPAGLVRPERLRPAAGPLQALPGTAPQNGMTPLQVGLIDGYRFSQECLARALAGANALLTVHPFDSVADYLAAGDRSFDLLLYYAHATVAWEAGVEADLRDLQGAARPAPLIVMSDIDEAQQPTALRRMMSSGARGFIPTRTTGMPITLAVIRFIRAGGVYAPFDLPPEPAAVQPVPADAGTDGARAAASAARTLFTARQMQVLALLRQGKANKNIAHALAMSESTVKVHIRNIMRLTGATNRTQAAFRVEGWENGAGGR